MRVLVIGANGATGRLVVERLAAHKDHEPVAMIRNPDLSREFNEKGVETVIGDLEHPIDEVVKGCDAVIFAAGSGGKTGKDKTVLIDHIGAIRAAVAALENGARRFVMLSGLKTSPNPPQDVSIRHWRKAKGLADEFIRTMPEILDGRGLDYTIVCPGKLDNDERPDNMKILEDIHATYEDNTTSRHTLAAVLVACLDEPATVGKTFGMMNGDVPVPEALKLV